MTRQSLSLLAALSLAACGTGRVVPADTAEPAAGPAAAPVASPGPTSAPAPKVPEGEPTATTAAPAPAPAATGAPSPAPTATAGTNPTVAPAAPAAPAAGYAPYDSSGSIAIRRIGQWSTSSLTAPTRVVIRDDTTYSRFWSSLGDAGSRPSVDFTRDLVIAVAAGQQAAGGHSIAVDRVTRVGPGLAVEVVETVPPQGCATTQALSQPVDVVVVAAGDAQTWSFSDRRVTGAC